MFKLDYTNQMISFNQVLLDNELYLAKEIVSAIFKAIDSDLDYIEVGDIVLPFENITLKVSKPYFKETLDINMTKLIKYEEYELCAHVKKYIDNLSK